MGVRRSFRRYTSADIARRRRGRWLYGCIRVACMWGMGGCMVVGPRVRAAVGYEARECQGARRLACAMGCQLVFLRRETRDERQETEGSKSEPLLHILKASNFCYKRVLP
eukprot:scaffold25205_cov49-Phaeocystis_antarctica.AAC.1